MKTVKLRPCPCCKKMQTNKNALCIGYERMDKDSPWFVYYNCKSCGSTFVFEDKGKRKVS